jgi:beta-galactosidase
LETFVSKVGKLIVDGMTAFFDDNLHNTMKTGFPFARLLGGNISEFKAVDNLFEVKIDKLSLPGHLWRGFIQNNSAKVISTIEDEPVATRNQFGRGETLWIPSLLGLGARLGGNEKLARLLALELKANFSRAPFVFASQQKGLLMKTLQSGGSFFTVVVNKSKDAQQVDLTIQNKSAKPSVLFADKNGTVSATNILISPEETMVIEWK